MGRECDVVHGGKRVIAAVRRGTRRGDSRRRDGVFLGIHEASAFPDWCGNDGGQPAYSRHQSKPI